MRLAEERKQLSDKLRRNEISHEEWQRRSLELGRVAKGELSIEEYRRRGYQKPPADSLDDKATSPALMEVLGEMNDSLKVMKLIMLFFLGLVGVFIFGIAIMFIVFSAA
ncbi:MAG: hypothetical protein LBQ21_05100 [Clostridiales Family XIII bacterium]|nr:hypothetical protein [Clostridiales Family XIII bacterium]